MTSPTPTPEQFLGALFSAHDPLAIHVVAVSGDPNQTKSWFGGRVGAGYALPPDKNLYYSVGLLDPNSKGRSLTHLSGHQLIAFDDVGTKAPASNLEALRAAGFEPIAISETSPGNFQWVFRLDRFVPEDGGEASQVLAMLRDHFKVQGWGDPGCFDPVRYMRIPGGINGKGAYANPLDGSPWTVRPTHFDPSASVDLYKLAEHVVGTTFLQLATSGAYLSSRQLVATGGPSGNVGRMASLDDPYVQLAALVGLNPRQSTRAGVIDCDCPNHAFNNAHSSGVADGFAFINDGMCFCHHGHCAGFNSMDFRRLIADAYDAQVALGGHAGSASSAREFLARADLSRTTAGEPSVEEQVEDILLAKSEDEKRAQDAKYAVERSYIYVSETLSFFDVRDYRLLSADQFDREPDVLRVWPLGGKAKDRASVAILNEGAIERVVGITRVPGGPLVVDAPDQNGVTQRMVNIYRPSGVGRRKGVPTTWLNHIKLLYPDPEAHEYLIDLFAWGLQNPDKPVPIITMLVGDPGTGKDMLLRPLMRIIGAHNCDTLSPERLMGPWTGWQICRLIVLGEFTTRNHPTAHERLRDLTSPSVAFASINEKYKRTYAIKPTMWFLGTTNDTDSLMGVQAGDRRFAFMMSHAERIHEPGDPNTPFTNRYFDALADEWQTDEFVETLNDYLLTRPIRHFNPNAAPPRTDGQLEVLADNLSRPAQWVLDQVSTGEFQHRALISSKEIEDLAARARDVPVYVRNGMGSRAVRDGMRNAGFRSLRQLRVGAARIRLWVRSEDEKYAAQVAAMTPDQLKTEWAADQSKPVPSPFADHPLDGVSPSTDGNANVVQLRTA